MVIVGKTEVATLVSHTIQQLGSLSRNTVALRRLTLKKLLNVQTLRALAWQPVCGVKMVNSLESFLQN
jgi:hypothetical protein